jgi:hypothetical protein
VFRYLVIAQVVEPTSLLDAGRVLWNLGSGSAAKYGNRMRPGALSMPAPTEDVSLVRYDVTTLCFGAERKTNCGRLAIPTTPRLRPVAVTGLDGPGRTVISGPTS